MWVGGLPPREKYTGYWGGLLFLAARTLFWNHRLKDATPAKAAQIYANKRGSRHGRSPGSHRRSSASEYRLVGAEGVCPRSSPLYYNGRLYTFKDGGSFTVELRIQGELLYSERWEPWAIYYASASDGRPEIYIASAQRGVVVVLDAGEKFKSPGHKQARQCDPATPA